MGQSTYVRELAELARSMMRDRRVIPLRQWARGTVKKWKESLKRCDDLHEYLISGGVLRGLRQFHVTVRRSLVDERELARAKATFEAECRNVARAEAETRGEEGPGVSSSVEDSADLSDESAGTSAGFAPSPSLLDAMLVAHDVQIWVEGARDIYTEQIIACGKSGQTSLVTDAESDFQLVIKTNIGDDEEIREQVQDARIALAALNYLRAEIPNFGFLYTAADRKRERGGEKERVACARPRNGERSLSLFLEYVPPAEFTSLRAQAIDGEFGVTMDLIVQVLLAVAHAHERPALDGSGTLRFSHNDLHLNNVLVTPWDGDAITYRIGTRRYEATPERVARLIDFGRSYLARDIRGRPFESRTMPDMTPFGITRFRSNLCYDYARFLVPALRYFRREERETEHLVLLYLLSALYPWLLDRGSPARPITRPLSRAIDPHRLDRDFIRANIVPADPDTLRQVERATAFVPPDVDVDAGELMDFVLDSVACGWLRVVA